MADIQLENGYLKIANELVEELAKIPLNGTQWRIIMIIIRFTYGYQKKESELSDTFISKHSGIHKINIRQEIKKLIERKIVSISKEATPKSSRVIYLNKNYDEWIQVVKSLSGSQSTTATGSQSTTHIKKIIKTTIKTTNKEIDVLYLSLAQNLKDNILLNSPKVKVPINLNGWANDIRLMIEVDKREQSDIENVIKFATSNTFWSANILSAKKLRDKFDTLYLQMNSKANCQSKSYGVKVIDEKNLPTHLKDYSL